MHLLRLLPVVFVICTAAPADAQFRRPEDAAKYRQAAFSLMNNHMGRINAQLKSGSPNMGAVQSSAALVETLSKLPFEAFTPDSDLVANTRAKPDVWTQMARFKELGERMQAEAVKLHAVARSGDAKATQTQFGVLAKSCDNCHDDFRIK